MSVSNFTMLIDDKDIRSFGMILVGYKIQAFVERKTMGVDIPGAHGTQAVPSALSANHFTANVIFTGHNSDEVHARIRQFFAFMYATQNSHKLVFTDDADVIRYAVLNTPSNYNVIRGMDGALAELDLSFYMLDPFTYQSDTTVVSSVVEHGVVVEIENTAYECPAVFTLTNLGDAPVSGIALIVNDELATFSCILNPGDIIKLDTHEYEVTLNDEIRIDYWDGEMPMLKNGINIVYQQNTEHSQLLLSVEFNRQWV